MEAPKPERGTIEGNAVQAVLVKLRKTFKHLFIRNNTVHDDTLLDKLTTWLQSQLSADDEKCQKTISALDDVRWIPAIADHSGTMNVSVLSFGLKVLGQLCQSTVGRALLETNAAKVGPLLTMLINEFDPDKASLRFALLHLLMQVAGKELSFVPSQQSLVNVARRGINDSSIFVKRCAGDLLVCLFVLPTFSQFPWKPVVIELLDLLTVVQSRDPVSKANAQVALNVLQRFGSSRLLPSVYPALQADMTTIIPTYIQKIDTVELRFANYQLMTYLNIISFEGDSPPAHWSAFLDDILETNHIVHGEHLLIETCKSLVKCNIKVPAWLKSAMLRPLIVLSCWRSADNIFSPTECLPKWELRTKDFKIIDEDPLAAKIVFTILTNIAYLDACFVEKAERLALLDLLFHYLSSRNSFIIANLTQQEEKVVALQQKHQSAVIFAIAKLVDEWGGEWVGTLDVGVLQGILESLCTNLQNRTWTGWMATKGLQLLKKLLPLCHRHIEQLWGSLAPQLESAFVHWYFDRDWETTDAVLEVLAVIAELGRSHGSLQSWLETSASIKLAFLALNSQNSYLSACALSVFGNMSTIPHHIGACGTNGKPNKVHLLENVVKILLQGTEGTVRQAAANALYNWFKSGCIQSPEDKSLLYRSFLIASYELYWEVKLVAVNFWDQVLSDKVSGCPASPHEWETFLRPLAEIGFCDAVVGLVDDEDFSVCTRVTDLVMRLVDCLRPGDIAVSIPEPTNGSLDAESAPSPVAASSDDCVLDLAFSDKDKLSAIEATLNTADIDVINVLTAIANERVASENAATDSVRPESLAQELEVIERELEKCLSVASDRDRLEALASAHRRCRRPMSPAAFVGWLRALNVERLYEMTSQCTDLYESNCEALLDDILVVNYESDNEDDETAMDCY